MIATNSHKGRRQHSTLSEIVALFIFSECIDFEIGDAQARRHIRLGAVQLVVLFGLAQVGLGVIGTDFGAVCLVDDAADRQGDLVQLVGRAGVLQIQRKRIDGSVKAQLQNGDVRRAAGSGGNDRGAVQQVDDRIVLWLLILGVQSNGAGETEERTDLFGGWIGYVEVELLRFDDWCRGWRWCRRRFGRTGRRRDRGRRADRWRGG